MKIAEYKLRLDLSHKTEEADIFKVTGFREYIRIYFNIYIEIYIRLQY